MHVVLSTALFIFLICILVIVHELGHFLVARANGVFVEAFSVGIGPVLFEKTGKSGTKWRFSLFPIGGYVKMFGDADVSSVKETIQSGFSEEDMDKMSLHRKKPWQKLFVAAAGPVFNFVFAIGVLFFLTMAQGAPEYPPTITVAGEDSLAYTSGLRDGDLIIKANGKDIANFDELKEQIVASHGKEMPLEIKRNEETKEILVEMFKKEGEEIVPLTMLGIAPKDPPKFKKFGCLESITAAVLTTYRLAADNMKAIFSILTRKASTKNVGGVISIFKLTSQSASQGVASFVFTLAILSTVLGAVNLLPIPVLDGGTVLISAIEWIIGRPLNKKFVEVIFFIGLAFVVGLMLLGLWNDLANCKFFVWLENLFK
ncbi:zinc metalloprotease [Alphaproteobacteria bacterium]|nr:zinc metalloprotease [Alphaproteobacteria bacterium]